MLRRELRSAAVLGLFGLLLGLLGLFRGLSAFLSFAGCSGAFSPPSVPAWVSGCTFSAPAAFSFSASALCSSGIGASSGLLFVLSIRIFL